MHGNVWEWCWDWYDAGYAGGSLTDTAGAVSGSARVMRGGCWYSPAVGVRSAVRFYHDPAFRYYSIGFRVVCIGVPRGDSRDTSL